jgi:hypothetical protein
MLHAAELELVLQPQALVGVGDVRELSADVTAIDMLEARNDLAQGGALRLAVKNSVSRSASLSPA